MKKRCLWTFLLFSRLSLAAGIAFPTQEASLFQNPAGLVVSSRALSLSGRLEFPQGALTSPRVGALAFIAPDPFFLALGAQSNGAALLGTALNLTSEVQIGVSSAVKLSDLGASTLNLGGLTHALNDRLTLGLSALDLTHPEREWGLGAGYRPEWLDSRLTFGFDLSLSPEFNKLWIEPSVRLESHETALTVSFGASFGSTHRLSQIIGDGIGLGISHRWTEKILSRFDYNQLGDQFRLAFTWSP